MLDPTYRVTVTAAVFRLPTLYYSRIICCLFCATAFFAAPGYASKQVLREERTVAVEGATEIWRLLWDGEPGTVCGPDEVYEAVTCPCSGWAYAEYGKLSLVRIRGGREIDRMDLRGLFNKFDYPDAEKVTGLAYLQRWPMNADDWKREDDGDAGLIAEIKRRRAPTIMKLADYDRDGRSTEFLIEVGTLPCGRHQYAAVGVTKAIPSLHALTSMVHPDQPLLMPEDAWDALLQSPGPTAVTTWTCGDHGSDTRTELVVSANNGAIRAKEREYSCPANGESEELLQESEW